jgi:hypothetical protein
MYMMLHLKELRMVAEGLCGSGREQAGAASRQGHPPRCRSGSRRREGTWSLRGVGWFSSSL